MRQVAHRRGFTLIELLVVVAIIAILAAILPLVFSTPNAQIKPRHCHPNWRP